METISIRLLNKRLLRRLCLLALLSQDLCSHFLGDPNEVQYCRDVAHHVPHATFNLQPGCHHGSHRVEFSGQDRGDVVVRSSSGERGFWVGIWRGHIFHVPACAVPEIQIERKLFLQITFRLNEEEQVTFPVPGDLTVVRIGVQSCL